MCEHALINGLVPCDAPPPDYFSMMRELHGIGSRLNQIVIKAHTLHVIDTKRYDENYRMFLKALDRITDAVILPRSVDNGDNKHTSNVMLKRTPSYSEHPIKELFENGIPVTINTDDLLIFDSSISDEYLKLYTKQSIFG